MKTNLEGLPSEVAKRMTFEEQLTREAWLKETATHQHTPSWYPTKGSLPNLGTRFFKGEGCNTPGVTQSPGQRNTLCPTQKMC
jgi:hypothetical protein